MPEAAVFVLVGLQRPDHVLRASPLELVLIHRFLQRPRFRFQVVLGLFFRRMGGSIEFHRSHASSMFDFRIPA